MGKGGRPPRELSHKEESMVGVALREAGIVHVDHTDSLAFTG
jgi:hypothetical protein